MEHEQLLALYYLPGLLLLITNIVMISQLRTQAGSSADFQNSLSATLFSPTLCSVNLNYFGLPVLPYVSSIQGGYWASSSFPHPKLQPGNAFRIVRLANYRAYLVCFLSFRDHCLALPDVQCLKTIVFTHNCYTHYFSVISDKWINLSLLTLSCREAEITFLLFLRLEYIIELLHLSCNVYMFLCLLMKVCVMRRDGKGHRNQGHPFLLKNNFRMYF